jgi:hypothetical protein
VFVFTKRSGRRGRVRFLWWPLAISIVLSLVLSLALR